MIRSSERRARGQQHSQSRHAKPWLDYAVHTKCQGAAGQARPGLQGTVLRESEPRGRQAGGVDWGWTAGCGHGRRRGGGLAWCSGGVAVRGMFAVMTS